MPMTTEEAFWLIHDGLARQAPGSDETTRYLLGLAGVSSGQGLEIGCGPGRASFILAESGINLIATDTHQPFLDQIDAMAQEKDLRGLSIRNVSMEALDYPDEQFDIIWAEGSAYIMGWQAAVASWRRLLKVGGKLVATECCWLTENPSKEAKVFWGNNYPQMLTVSRARAIAEEEGYFVVDTYTLPAADWWDEYYSPILAKLEQLRLVSDDALRRAIAMSQSEIDLYRNHGREYGYVGLVLERRSR